MPLTDSKDKIRRYLVGLVRNSVIHSCSGQRSQDKMAPGRSMFRWDTLFAGICRCVVRLIRIYVIHFVRRQSQGFARRSVVQALNQNNVVCLWTQNLILVLAEICKLHYVVLMYLWY